MADRFISGGTTLGSKLLNGLGLPTVPSGAPGPLPLPQAGRVRLRTVDKRLDLTLRLDEEPASMTPQVPRIEQVEIAYRAARTWWAGQAPGELSIPCLLDGFPSSSIEGRVERLEDMARPRSAGKASGAPSPLQIAGNVPGTDRLWMIAGLDQRDAIWRNGFRVRQHFDISLTQWVPLEEADTPGRKNQRTAGGAKRRRANYTVKSGDTLTSIALRQLGSAKRWKDIAKLNPVRGKARRSPSDIRVGQSLKMPQD
jgi:hypothetical protein